MTTTNSGTNTNNDNQYFEVDDDVEKERMEQDRFQSRFDSAVQNIATANTLTMVSLKEQLEQLRQDPPSGDDRATKSEDSVSADKKNTVHNNDNNIGNNNSNSNSNSTYGLPPGAVTVVDDETEDGDGSTTTINASIIDPFGDRGDYHGEALRSSWNNNTIAGIAAVVFDAVPSGLGTMTYADGRTYRGRWRHGRWHGTGRATYPNGDSYEGTYSEDQRHGTGTYTWGDGRVYAGGFERDQRHGHGVYKWPDGSRYDGGFREGLRHGSGTYEFRDGSIYTGEWKKGSRHGKGEYRRTDGRVYKGDWVDGKAHGHGIETRPDGSVRHDGQWEDDYPKV